ncbi:hypothetical protein AX15_002945 [Amanita polypyramis BW_CC]|nr:hypothetical protein AX15_002945 [Amanita polypyramis BW_CC]
MAHADDDVQIVSERGLNHGTDPILCQICYEDLSKLSIARRQEHYEHHFQAGDSRTRGEGSAICSSGRQINKPKLHKWKECFPSINESDVFWYSTLLEPPPSNFLPGLVSFLKKALQRSHSQSLTLRATLCHPSIVHIRREKWDFSWGCGYRNYLMICSALLCQKARPEYHSLILNNSRRPGVRSLQRLIEEAWSAGFDQEGQQELKGLVGTGKWIGTADLYVAFTFCGIPCELVEFDLEDKSPDTLINWVVSYYSSKAKPTDINEALHGAFAVSITDYMPIILQHNGHSRTIVGYETVKGGTNNLLVFDPSFNRLRAAIIGSVSNPTDGLKRPMRECIGAPTRHDSPKRLRSTAEPIDVDVIEDTTAKSTKVHIRGGANGFNRLLPSGDKHYQQLLKACRLTRRKLSKEKQYQALYFPMTAPLTNEEKIARKVVTSTAIH